MTDTDRPMKACPKCRAMNRAHRRICVKCGKRIAPSKTMIMQEAARVAAAAPDPRSAGKTVMTGGRTVIMTKSSWPDVAKLQARLRVASDREERDKIERQIDEALKQRAGAKA